MLIKLLTKCFLIHENLKNKYKMVLTNRMKFSRNSHENMVDSTGTELYNKVNKINGLTNLLIKT